MYEADAKLIPQFVSARSPHGLRRAMIIINSRSGFWHKFFDIQFSQGKWIAWYYEKVTADDFKPVPNEGAVNG